MFAPTKTWRRWHRRINLNQKRYAMTSAIAATGIPALVMSKGMLLIFDGLSLVIVHVVDAIYFPLQISEFCYSRNTDVIHLWICNFIYIVF